MDRRVIHKGVWLLPNRPGLAVLAALLFTSMARGQDLVQAVVDGLDDPAVARAASLMTEEQDGVLMARFDVHTRNMMLHVAPACTIGPAALQSLLTPLGLHIRCYDRRDAREAPFRHLDPARCSEPVLHAR